MKAIEGQAFDSAQPVPAQIPDNHNKNNVTNSKLTLTARLWIFHMRDTFAQGHLQVLKVVELEVLGRNGAEPVPVQPQHQQGVGQVLKAVRLQHGDAVVIHVPEQNGHITISLASLSRIGFIRNQV